MKITTNVKSGDKVRVIDADYCKRIEQGSIREVDKVKDGFVYLVGRGHDSEGWLPWRFEEVEEPKPTPVSRDPEPTVLLVDPSPVHLRPYDFDAGDKRFFDREMALACARFRVKERGCRQQVRSVPISQDDEAVVPRWLVQDI